MNFHNPLTRAKRTPNSLRNAIDAHCYMCMGGEEADLKTRTSIVSMIQDCESEVCPLRPVRGFTPSNPQGNRQDKEEPWTV